MGQRRRTHILRFLVCLFTTLAVMTYIAPKVC